MTVNAFIEMTERLYVAAGLCAGLCDGSFFIPFTIDIIWKTSYNGDSRLFPRVLISGSAGKDGMELYFSAILMIEYTL